MGDFIFSEFCFVQAPLVFNDEGISEAGSVMMHCSCSYLEVWLVHNGAWSNFVYFYVNAQIAEKLDNCLYEVFGPLWTIELERFSIT